MPNDNEIEKIDEGEKSESDDENADLEIGEPPTQEVDENEVVLATISGESKFTPLKVAGKISDHLVVVLIEGGASHNFIDETFVTEKKLIVESFAGFGVKQANGQISICTQVCRQVEVRFGNHAIVEDFYVFPMGWYSPSCFGSAMMVFFGRILNQLQDFGAEIQSKWTSNHLEGNKGPLSTTGFSQ